MTHDVVCFTEQFFHAETAYLDESGIYKSDASFGIGGRKNQCIFCKLILDIGDRQIYPHLALLLVIIDCWLCRYGILGSATGS